MVSLGSQHLKEYSTKNTKWKLNWNVNILKEAVITLLLFVQD